MKLRSVLSGTLIASVIAVLFVVIMAVISYLTGINDSAANVCVYAGAALGVFMGAFSAARTCGGRILLNSMSVSVLCMVILMILSLVMNGRINFNMHFLAVALGVFFAGFLGAITGK